MTQVKVKTQSELDDALKRGLVPMLVGNGYFEVRGSSQVTACHSSQVRAYDSAQVTACGSSQVRACGSSQVRAYDSSQVTACHSSQVTAYDSSQVTACGSSQVRAFDLSQVTACDSAQVRACDWSQVTAYDSSQVTACDWSQVRATQYVAVTRHGADARVTGGILIQVPKIATAQEWCDFYGVEVKDGVAKLFKALTDDFKSGYGFDYTPGTTPVAPDWDGGKVECGKGLHFSPRPFMALEFMSDAKRFVACPVRLRDIAVHPNASMPQKVKASGCCAPVWECDIDGNPVGSKIAEMVKSKPARRKSPAKKK